MSDDELILFIYFSIRDNSVVENYVDCEWSRTYILRKDTLDIPEDSDLIIGYLFSVSSKRSIEKLSLKKLRI